MMLKRGRTEIIDPLEVVLAVIGSQLDDRVSLARRLVGRVRQQAFEQAYEIAQSVASKYCRKYAWEDPDDLANSLMLRFDRIYDRFDPVNTAGNVWTKYCYWRFDFEAKDYFRRLDPLGIKWPQKKEYPQWHRLQDEGLDGYVIPDERTLEILEPSEDDLRSQLEFLRQQTTHKHPQRDIRRTFWDQESQRIKFRKSKKTQLQTFVRDYWERKRLDEKPKQMTLELT